MLHDALNELKMESEIWRYPNRSTSIGRLINSYLTKEIELEDHAVHLLFSANRWETVDQMKEKLNKGVNLIVDRYAYSGVAYTAAKTGFDFDWCKQCDKGLPKPDLVFFMDSNQLKLDSRECFGTERYEINDFQNLVYNNFKKLFNLEEKIKEDFLVLNANDTIESLHSRIISFVLEILKKNIVNEINLLW